MESASAASDHGGMSITFRRGTDPDARAAAELWLRARRAAVGAIPPTIHDDDDVRAWFASHVVRDTDLWLAVDAAGRPVGILVLNGPWIDQLYVEPTFASNTGAQRFYERHGFVATRRTDGRDNEEGAPDILYVWGGEQIGD